MALSITPVEIEINLKLIFYFIMLLIHFRKCGIESPLVAVKVWLVLGQCVVCMPYRAIYSLVNLNCTKASLFIALSVPLKETHSRAPVGLQC